MPAYRDDDDDRDDAVEDGVNADGEPTVPCPHCRRSVAPRLFTPTAMLRMAEVQGQKSGTIRHVALRRGRESYQPVGVTPPSA